MRHDSFVTLAGLQEALLAVLKLVQSNLVQQYCILCKTIFQDILEDGQHRGRTESEGVDYSCFNHNLLSTAQDQPE